MADLDQVKQEYSSVLEELANPDLISDRDRFQELKHRKDQLETIIAKNSALGELDSQILENQSLMSSGEDPDLNTLALEELKTLKQKQADLKAELEVLLKSLPETKKKGVKTEVIVEIRAGVGGEEAALFAQNLFEMYQGFAKSLGWQTQVLDSSQTDLGGLKEIVFEIKPVFGCLENDVFSKMIYEAGVHRVQRIPETEKSGRVHTSTATVAVLLKPKKVQDLKINLNDIKIDFFNATGPGGQNVNKRKTAVRITHLPSGLIITSRTERSQLQNKESALAILAAKLSEKQLETTQGRVSGQRRAQIGGGERAEKIRTYNFPQDRLTDHRVKKSWHNLEEILHGKLGPIINELEKQLTRQAGQVVEGLLLLLGLVFIFLVALPRVSEKAKVWFGLTGPVPERMFQNADAPLCGDIVVVPGRSGQVPFKATFVGTGKENKYPISGFRWDFEGNNSWDTPVTTQAVDYTFQSPATYKVRMLVVDEKNNSRVCSTTITVLP